jgi:hypothetical protein
MLDAMIPMLDFAMPYEAPKQVKTMAAAQPMAPKKDCWERVSSRVGIFGTLISCGWWSWERLDGEMKR